MPFGGNSGGKRGRLSSRSSVTAVLDIGTSKVTCLIGRLRQSQGEDGPAISCEVLGIGHQRAHGVKGGVVIDMDAAEHAIRAAVDAAERMADLTVEAVLVNVTCGRLQSEAYSAAVAIAGHQVEEQDIAHVLAAGRDHRREEGRLVLHSIPIGYKLDGNRGIRDPRGMLGEQLGVDIHVVTADAAPLRNLTLCIERCHLAIAGFVATPYASGLTTIVDDEAALGVLCIDMGAGSTSWSVFFDGHFVHADAIAIGGQHVTLDIARGLSTPVAHAERLKTLYGAAFASPSDDRETIPVPHVGDEEGAEPARLPRAHLTAIIEPRIEELLELVRDRLAASGFASYAGKRAAITGGAGQLTGMADMAGRILGKEVRIGRPRGVTGLPEAEQSPAFAAAAGLLLYPALGAAEIASRRSMSELHAEAGYFSRVGRWLKENF